MAKIYNSDVTKGLANNAGIQQNVDKTPNELAEKIVPTFETNPEQLRVSTIAKSARNTNSTNTIIYQPPSTKQFYLTSAHLSFCKDVTSTASNFWIQVTIDGATTYILRTASLTLTADRADISVSFPKPLKLDRGQAIYIFCDAFKANQQMIGSITGYEVENIRI